MPFLPTQLDIWIALRLAGLLGHYPLFDLGVQSLIRHDVFGGLTFGAVLFVYHVRAIRGGDTETQYRMATTLVASLIVIFLTFLASALASWRPPNQELFSAGLFPEYIERSPTSNCFPSQSTALYICVAAGMLSLSRTTGWLLGFGVILLVSLPRMYVGGHYLTDVLAGLALGLAGYAAVRVFCAAKLARYLERTSRDRPRMKLLGDVVMFLWILEVSVGFSHAEWAVRSSRLILAGLV
jgi:membrane-associated phospholipid phosphatase